MDHIVCRLPGIELPKGAEFSIKEKGNSKRLHGAANGVSYEGDLENPTKYALAVEGPDGKIKLVPAQVTDLVVKAQKIENQQKDAEQQELWRQRTTLGETFGTKKAKSAIADRSRNRLDAGSLETLEDAIVGRVKATTADLPTEADRKKTAEQDRKIPPHDIETKSVKDVYPLKKLIPTPEFNLLEIGELINATGDDRFEYLYKTDSRWINLRVEKVIQENVEVATKLRQLVYMSLLFKVYELRRSSSKQQLMEKLGSPPEPLVAGIIERFTVARRGFVGKSRDRSFAFDPTHVDKLLAYILVLALHIDGFQIEVHPLAHEVGLAAHKLVNLLRSVGCSIKAASSGKVAKLTAPLVLPEMTKRGAAKR